MINSQMSSSVPRREDRFTFHVVNQPGTPVPAGEDINPQIVVEMKGPIKEDRQYQAVASKDNQHLPSGVSGSVEIERYVGWSGSVKLGFPGLKLDDPGEYKLTIEFLESEIDGSSQLVWCGSITLDTIIVQ